MSYTPDFPKLKELGLTFECTPSLMEKGFSTFIQDVVDPNHYICVKKYSENCIQNKQKKVAEVLQDLGIHQYVIDSYWEFTAGLGMESNSSAYVEIKSERHFNGGKIKRKNTDTTNITAKMHERFFSYNKFEGRKSISEEEWRRARENARRYGLLSEIEDIINKRDPRKANKFLFNEDFYNIGGQINVNIKLASFLSFLSCFQNMSGSTELTSLFDFNTELMGEYKTKIVYNFDPDKNYEKYIEYMEVIDNYNKKKNDLCSDN